MSGVVWAASEEAVAWLGFRTTGLATLVTLYSYFILHGVSLPAGL